MPALDPGDVIEIEGVSEQPDFAPQIGQPRWRVVGTGALPAAPRVAYGQMASTHQDGQWVEVQGIVRTAGIDPESKNLLLDIGMEGGLITAQIPNFKLEDAQRLIDSEVLIRGNCGAVRNALNQQIGLMLYVPSLAQVRAMGPAPPEAFSQPPRPLAELQQFALDQPSGHRVHVRGIVAFHEPDGATYLADPTGGFSIQSKQPTPLNPGDRVDLLGFLGVVDRHPLLEDSIFQVTSTGRAPDPVTISAEQALQGEFDSELVKMQGLLGQIALTPNETVLVLRQGTIMFTAVSRTTVPSAELKSLREGAIVQVTGVCVVDSDWSGAPKSFMIRFHAPDGVVVLRRPPWLTRERALEALGITMLVVVAAAAWVLVLKRRVKRQTNIIRQRYERQAALEEQYAEAQRLAHVGSWEEEVRGQKTAWSEETFRILDYQMSEVSPSREAFLARVHPDDRGLVRKIIEEAFAGSFSAEEFRIRRPGGEERFVISAVRPVTDANARPIRIFGALQDITERKRVERSLEERTAYLNALVENSPLAIVVVDSDTRVQICNPAFEGLFQYRREEIGGAQLNELIAPRELLQEATVISSKVEKEGQHAHFTTRRRRKDGSLVDVELYGVPLRVAGKLVGVYGLYLDITDRKKAESELQKAKEAAEAANRAKSEFLANMSHEIRTPMNGVLGATELALDTDLNPEQREYLSMTKTSAEILLSILDDILDYSKIEAGKFDLDPISFRLRESLAQAMKPLAVRAQQKGLEFTCDVHPDVPEQVIADPTRLRQVIINLVSNAIKFTDQGEVGLEIAVEAQEQDQLQLHFQVHDTGIGIAVEKQSVIFEAFSQADGSTARRFGGTGLGLTISSRLVKMLGGRIWLESEPARGSRFHFTAQARVAHDAAPVKPAGAADLAGLRALVVDDNATNRRILAEMLQRRGVFPTLAGGSIEAAALLGEADASAQAFDLFLVDAHMPGTDGFALVEQSRRHASASRAAVIMLASAGQRGDAARCRKLGVDAYLTKPVTESELLDAVLTTLGAQVKRAEPPALITRHSLREGQRKLCILVAEDNAVNQMLAARLIEKQGHATTVVSNGREALAALEKGSYDVVLMDVQMPEMDGFEATAEIRRKEETTGKHVPIIAMTDHAMRGDRERCLNAGMDSYVCKPIRPEELFREIYSYTQPLGPAPPSTAPTKESSPGPAVEATATERR
jgi:PAS domain S-box-containing protein